MGPLVHLIAVIPTIPKNGLALESVLLCLAVLQAMTPWRTLTMKMSWLIWREENLSLFAPLLPSPGLDGPPSSLHLLPSILPVPPLEPPRLALRGQRQQHPHRGGDVRTGLHQVYGWGHFHLL